jgi:hypothetical protein
MKLAGVLLPSMQGTLTSCRRGDALVKIYPYGTDPVFFSQSR